MEEQFKKEDRIIMELISEAGLEKPSMNFDNAVMEKILNLETKSVVYRPLISPKAWIFIGLFVAAIIIYFVFFTAGNESGILSSRLPEVNFDLPKFDIPSTFIYATLFLGLFLLQVPILKHKLIDRN